MWLFLLLVIPILGVLWLAPASELLCYVRRRRGNQTATAGGTPQFLFLVPAHNEEGLIGACVSSLLAMRYPDSSFEVVVIADNCTDATPRKAREEGALCLERHDPEKPGKPAAIAWALQQIEQAKWEACVIIDADTEVGPLFAERLAGHAPLADKAVQGYFDLSNENQNWLTRLAGVLARVRYEHSYPLRQAAGLNCPLTGNGMCIGRSLLADGWPAFSLTENWELYAGFTAAGVEIEYEAGARLFSQEASQLSQAKTQRQRWLAGRISVLFQYMGALLRSPKIGMHQKLDALGELASPSPVLHGTIAFFIALTGLLFFSGWLVAVLAAAALLSLLPLILHTLQVIRRHPARWQIAGSFLLLPMYALWRVTTVVLSIETIRHGEWKKTERV